MVLFCNVIDVAVIPASIVWLCVNPEWTESEGKRRRAMFLRELGYSLVMPHMERRSSIQTLQRPARQAMQTFSIQRCLPSATRSSNSFTQETSMQSALVEKTKKLQEYVLLARSQFVLNTVRCRLYAMSARMPSDTEH